MRSFFVAVAFVGPLFLHWAIVRESDALLRVFLLLAAAVLLIAGMRTGNLMRHVLGAVVLVGAAYLVDIRIARALTPIWAAFVYAGLAWVFGRTLRSGFVPLIERFARMEHPEGFPAELVHYARRVTFVWSIFFVVLALITLLLAFLTSTETLSLFTNVLSWVFLSALYFAEYAYRQWWAFPQFAHKNPVRVAINIVRNAPQLMR